MPRKSPPLPPRSFGILGFAYTREYPIPVHTPNQESLTDEAEEELEKTAGNYLQKIGGKDRDPLQQKGDNGSVCTVMRGFSAPTYTPAPFRNLVYDPTVRAPICFTPQAVREVLPYYELRTQLAMQGKNPDEIAEGVQAAYAKGELPKRTGVSFAYMWSADQNLASGVGHWHPHVMVFAPYYDNSALGGNTFGSPLPQVTDDAGTPFTVVVIPVDDNLAVKADLK